VEFELLENCGVHEEERLVGIHPIISAHRDPFPAREDLQVYVKLFPEDMKFLLGFALFICINVFMAVHLRGLSRRALRAQW